MHVIIKSADDQKSQMQMAQTNWTEDLMILTMKLERQK